MNPHALSHRLEDSPDGLAEDESAGRDESEVTGGGRGAPARRSWQEPHPAVALLACIVVGSVLWDVGRSAGVISTTQTASFEDMVTTAVRGLIDGSLLAPLGETVLTLACGLALSVMIGLPIGLAMGRSRAADATLGLTVDVLRPIPAVALVPVAVVVLGLGLRMQVSLIAFAAVWPIVFNARYGARNVDPVMIDTARLAGLSRWRTMARVVLPASMPAVMTGIRLAAAVAVVLTIVTEIVASGTGLGYDVTTSQQVGDTDRAFAGVLLAALLGTVVNSGVLLLEKRITGWHQAQQVTSR